MFDKEKIEMLKELLGADGIEVIQASSVEEGMAKIKELVEKKTAEMSDENKSKLVDKIMSDMPSYEKYLMTGTSLLTLLTKSGVPHDLIIPGSLSLIANCSMLDYAEEMKVNTDKPCMIEKFRDDNLIPFIAELKEKIKPLIETVPTNKVVSALSAIALETICKEDELNKKMKNKIDPMDAIKNALDKGNLLEAQGILNTILKNQ